MYDTPLLVIRKFYSQSKYVPMFILGFDTSNAYSSVAISNRSEIIFSVKDIEPNAQAERLIVIIENALKKVGIEYNQLDYLAASSGPGSFTGVRIALAAARGIILGCPSIKPVCINNFQTINFRVREQVIDYDFLVTSVNAYRDQLYLQLFSKKGEIEEPKLLFLDEAKDFMESLKGQVIVSGSGIEKIYTCANMPPKNLTLLPRFAYPDARFVCKVAHQKIVQGKSKENFEPLYIRLPDAKVPDAPGLI